MLDKTEIICLLSGSLVDLKIGVSAHIIEIRENFYPSVLMQCAGKEDGTKRLDNDNATNFQ